MDVARAVHGFSLVAKQKIMATRKGYMYIVSLWFHSAVCVNEFRTKLFYPVLDRCLSELHRRFSNKNIQIMNGISSFTPVSTNFLKLEYMEPIAELYKCNIDDLKLEVKQIKKLISRNKETENLELYSLFDFHLFISSYRDAFFETQRILRILCVIPVSTASCERSFLTMKQF